MDNEPRKVPPIKIINKMSVQKSTSQNTSDVDNDIFVSDWTDVKSPNHKRKNSNSSPVLQTKNIKASNNTSTQFTSKNRFAELSNEDQDINMEINTDITDKKPPPIFIKTLIKNYLNFCNNIKKVIEPDSDFSCKSTTNALKLNLSTTNSFRAVTKFLKEKKFDYYTYQLKEEKAYRVVIRNLHHTTPIEFIKEEINLNGFLVRNITNVLHSQNKTPLPLFFVDLEPSPNNSDIFKINSLCYSKIKIEAPKPKKQPPQCMNCQDYGHTRAYCNRPPRCVRCGDFHTSVSCQKKRELPAKCALCSGDHPANYKGCPIFKNIQNRIPQVQTQHKSKPSLEETTSQKIVLESNPYNNNTSESLKKQNININPSYSQVTQNKNNPTNNAKISDQCLSENLTILLSSFINDLKSLINPLISLLTTVINKILLKDD